MPGQLTEFDAALYLFLVMVGVTAFCLAFDWWLAAYDRRTSVVSERLRRPYDHATDTRTPNPEHTQ